ncbi:hypothetical protein BD626DRAFT_432494 [Schizophyllum amplum]|uniref:Uncharacterized protein n=1 Tax=Schizophyllum amplum TaxID=97359 RepID=A0A550CE21_9AGAR|nr:hypothetical protein BD626DRAFT_432494 [Auriculariopsis ampla]
MHPRRRILLLSRTSSLPPSTPSTAQITISSRSMPGSRMAASPMTASTWTCLTRMALPTTSARSIYLSNLSGAIVLSGELVDT